MQTQMTQKDKKLIVFLAIFVIVVAGGYWGIYPVISSIFVTNQAIADGREQENVNSLKMAQVAMLEADNETMEQDMTDLKQTFFPMMTSDQVDKYITGLVLDYHLSAYDLNIVMPESEAVNEPYQYSDKAQEVPEDDSLPAPGTEAETSVHATESAEAALDSTTESAQLFAEEEAVSTGVYMVEVSAKVGGEEAALERLIDDLSVSDKKQHLLNYSWGEESSLSFAEDGTFQVGTDRTLTMTLDLYMCEE